MSRLRDSILVLGTFSQKRSVRCEMDLISPCSLPGMNDINQIIFLATTLVSCLDQLAYFRLFFIFYDDDVNSACKFENRYRNIFLRYVFTLP